MAKSSVSKSQRANNPLSPKASKKKRGKLFLWLGGITLGLCGLTYAGLKIKSILEDPAGRLTETAYVYVTKSSDIESVRLQIQKKIVPRYPNYLDYVIKTKKLEEHIRPGRYAITPQMTTEDVVNTLLSGVQTPVHLKLNLIRTEGDLRAFFTKRLLLKDQDLEQVLRDSTYLSSLGYNRESIRSLFLVGEYQLLWDTSAKELISQFKRHHDRFWDDARRAKADSLGLSTNEVATLASIVEEESAKTDEYSRIAGLYINRLKKGIKLQSDPTVKFALGEFGLRRILYEHLKVESPYNTYYTEGLPPAPIRIPKPSTIDYVLSAEPHDYIYMVAKEDFSGRHNFSKSYQEHQSNARKYQKALNARGIK